MDTSVIYLTITISASLIILSAVAYFLYNLWYSLARRSRTSPVFDAASPPTNNLQKFSYGELRAATNSFSPSNSVGKGGSATVYRGTLRDGREIAVKLLDPSSTQTDHEFQNELKILGGLRKSCPFIVPLLGFCVERWKRLVVYEYMPNRSLQELLFTDSNLDFPRLNWGKRFDVIKDVAKALAFLHLECDPPVIHGDVKPSNVLLDSDFRAKLSDFGLSRLKLDNENGVVDLISQDLLKSQELSEVSNSGVGIGSEKNVSSTTPPLVDDEVDFALALQASSTSKNSCNFYHNAMGLPTNWLSFGGSNSDSKGKELMMLGKSVPCDEDELGNVDRSKELKANCDEECNNNDGNDEMGSKQWGKDWWWRQDGSGELCSKDYVMEWIGSQICHSGEPDWDEEKGPIQEKPDLDNFDGPNENHGQQLDCPNDSCVEQQKVTAKKKHNKKMHEWWKDERLSNASNTKRKVPHFGLGKCFEFRTNCKNIGDDQKVDDFSFPKGNNTLTKCKENCQSMGSETDLFSRELSSTTSMRGTLCYNSFGYLMEKADVYSFGVLMLVIISGRRPLHVLSSPMKLEKANLISWCRNLAHCGDVLELVDGRLGEDYSREEASLCINLAISCLQKMPEMRPDIGDVVKVLDGKMDLPTVSFEFSPSPPSKVHGRSRRKRNSNQD